MKEPYLTIKQAAARLGVSEPTLRRWDQSGRLKPTRHPINGYRLYAPQRVDELARRLHPTDEGKTPSPLAEDARSRAPSRLPLPPTTFVGRAAELEQLSQLLDRARLVTVVGPPGIGKTRLALRAVERYGAAGARPRAALFCDLTEATTLEELCAAVCRALGVSLPLEAGPASVATVGEALAAHGEALLVLDNFERLVASAAGAVGRWLEIAPGARLLVTSRERLRVAGERALELGPLELPVDGSGWSAADAEAVRLFLDRAAAVTGREASDPEEFAVVAAIVRQLEGNPLAIELAAARTSVLAPAMLLPRLARRLDLLVGQEHERVTRHVTLRGAIDGSWHLLTLREQRALARCSVFRGGFSLEAAEAVLEPAGDGDAFPALTAIESLRDRSLLWSLEPPELPGERRFGLYLSIREYAEERLEELGETEATFARHAAYFVRAGQAWAEAVATREGAIAQRRLALEQDNLLAVHRRMTTRSPPDGAAAEAALGAALALDPLLFNRGPVAGYVSMLETAIELSRAQRLPPLRIARALDARGRARRTRGDGEAARRDHEEALAIARDAGDAPMQARSLEGLSVLLRHEGRLDDALVCAEEALVLHRASGAPREEARTLATLTSILHDRGRLDEARRCAERCLEILAGTGGPWIEAVTHLYLAAIDQEQGRHAESLVRYERAIPLLRDADDPRFEAIAIGYRATLHHEQGSIDLARDGYHRAFSRLSALDLARFQGVFRACCGALEAEGGRLGEALGHFDRAAALIGRVGDPPLRGALEVHRGHLDLLRAREAAASGRHEEAAAHRAAAARRVEAALRVDPQAPGSLPLASQSDDVRFALRLLRRGLQRIDVALRELPPSDVLLVAHDGTWFQPPRARRIDLSRRRSLPRLLALLAARRLEAPGGAVSRDELLAAGWPGERMLVDSGAHRVQVGLATLRRLGLRAYLLSRADGYLLDPDAELRLARGR